MCGRYSITVDKRTIERRFNAHFATAGRVRPHLQRGAVAAAPYHHDLCAQ